MGKFTKQNTIITPQLLGGKLLKNLLLGLMPPLHAKLYIDLELNVFWQWLNLF